MRFALLLLVLPFSADLAGALRAELSRTDERGRLEILAGLPARMADRPAKERAALAPLLSNLLADDAAARLHASCLAPLVATGTVAGVARVLALAYAREETPLREVARRALADDPHPETSALLARLLRRDRSPYARAWTAILLGRRGARAAGAEETLAEALGDPEAMVRGAAAEALTRIYRLPLGYDRTAWRARVEEGPPPPPPAPDPAPADGTAASAPDPARLVARLAPDFFGIPLDRDVVVVVLDFSASTRGPGMERIRAELGRALALLPSTRTFTVLAFDTRLLSFRTAPVPALPGAKEDLVRFLGDLPPGQRTELLLPIRTGIALAAEHAGDGGAQVLIISDGAPTAEGPPLADLLARATSLGERGVRVDAAVVGGRPVGLFRHLVRASGGREAALPSAR